MKKQSGFTLIELMIVVAIIAILAAIAIPAYNGYIAEANATRVNTAYTEAINAAKSEMARRQTILSRGGTYTEPDLAGWIAIFNPDGNNAPGAATNMYAGTADAASGVIGVAVAGTGATRTVTLTRPAYDADGAAGGESDLVQQTATINATSLVTYGT